MKLVNLPSSKLSRWKKTMATEIKPLDQLLKELPQESQAEVRNFVESLIEKRKRQSARYLRQNWAGALEDYREQFTSLELQMKSLDWRGEY
jgi:Protein of unknown function (DUF2281)